MKRNDERRQNRRLIVVYVHADKFKTVKTMAEGSQFYVVQPLDTGKRILRPGDRVIVRARDLYDGKVVG